MSGMPSDFLHSSLFGIDRLILPAGSALSFVDAATGQPILSGLRCEIVLRRTNDSLGVAHTTPGGWHHWPSLARRWQETAPGLPAQADVLVSDTLERFLPVTLCWPLPSAAGGSVLSSMPAGKQRLLQVRLHSAPARPAPSGLVSVHGQLVWQASLAPAAWARVFLKTGEGHEHHGICDAAGGLSLHLLQPPPPPSHPAPASPEPTLQVFFDPALASRAARLGAPDVAELFAQTEVKALARSGLPDALDRVPLTAGEGFVLITQDLDPRRSELRLVPL